MLPSFKDFINQFSILFDSSNKDAALIKILTLFNEEYSAYNPYLEHDKLYKWIKRNPPKNVCDEILSADINKFKEYINNSSENLKKTAIESLESFKISSNINNLHNKLSTIFLDIIRAIKKLPDSAELRYEKESKYHKIYGAEILISQNKKCALCNNYIVLKSINSETKFYQNFHIVETKPSENPCFENLIAICNDDCYCNYLDNYESDPLMQETLLANKQQFILNYNKQQIIENNHIEPQIYDIIKNLKKEYNYYANNNQNKYDVTKIQNKIKPENNDLKDKIKFDCDISFGYISKLFKAMNSDSSKVFNNIKVEINDCFKSIDNFGLPQWETYNALVSWLLSKANFSSDYQSAAERIVSFFVQMCEVFK